MKIQIWMVISFWCLVACSNPNQGQDQENTENTEAMDTIEDTPMSIAAIDLVDLQGNPVNWKDLRGKTVFLNFWATWCKPCIVEMPSMDEAYQSLQDENFVFLAASYEEPEKIKNFQEKQNFSFQFVHVKNSLESLSIYSIPTTFIISKEGELVETVVGSRQWDDPEILNKLKQM